MEGRSITTLGAFLFAAGFVLPGLFGLSMSVAVALRLLGPALMVAGMVKEKREAKARMRVRVRPLLADTWS